MRGGSFPSSSRVIQPYPGRSRFPSSCTEIPTRSLSTSATT